MFNHYKNYTIYCVFIKNITSLVNTLYWNIAVVVKRLHIYCFSSLILFRFSARRCYIKTPELGGVVGNVVYIFCFQKSGNKKLLVELVTNLSACSMKCFMDSIKNGVAQEKFTGISFTSPDNFVFVSIKVNLNCEQKVVQSYF